MLVWPGGRAQSLGAEEAGPSTHLLSGLQWGLPCPLVVGRLRVLLRVTRLQGLSSCFRSPILTWLCSWAGL